jgi:cation transport regulator ChaC
MADGARLGARLWLPAITFDYCLGPGGPNTDYLLDLAIALREIGLEDQHVFDIERHTEEITGQQHL